MISQDLPKHRFMLIVSHALGASYLLIGGAGCHRMAISLRCDAGCILGGAFLGKGSNRQDCEQAGTHCDEHNRAKAGVTSSRFAFETDHASQQCRETDLEHRRPIDRHQHPREPIPFSFFLMAGRSKDLPATCPGTDDQLDDNPFF